MMQTATKNPLLWLLLLLTAWACLAAPNLGQKTASRQNFRAESASGEMTAWEAAPRLGFGGLAEESASAALVGANTAVVDSAAGGTNYVTLYRGDTTAQSQFLSKLGQSQGVEASNAAIAKAEGQGSVSYLFENHALNSGESPYISLTTSPEVAQSFARGTTGTQAGYVTEFRLPANFAEPNFENLNTWEREYLAPTQIDNKFIVNQYQVTPKKP